MLTGESGAFAGKLIHSRRLDDGIARVTQRVKSQLIRHEQYPGVVSPRLARSKAAARYTRLRTSWVVDPELHRGVWLLREYLIRPWLS